MILNINQLRAFYAAAKNQSVSIAAQDLMVTPPAITMQIKKFEESVGMRLMFREKNTIRLTEMGETVLKRAHVIFKNIHEMEELLEDISITRSGELRIGCPRTPAMYFMPKLITKFKETYPGIKIILDEGTSGEMAKSILSLKNELAVVHKRPDTKRLKLKMIGKDEVLLVAAPDSRHIPGREISVAQLASVPLVMMKAGSATREVVMEYLQKFGIRPAVTMESANLDLAKEFIRRDNAVGLLGKYAVTKEVKEGMLKSVRIVEGSPYILFGIAYLRKKSLSPNAWAFLRLLEKMENVISTGSHTDGQETE